ncbi:MAG: hypothetical protein ACYCUT_00515 [bacterium]
MKRKKTTTMPNTVFKQQVGNTTVSFVRGGIFSPVVKSPKRPQDDIIFKNHWAKLTILKKYNRITQVHINILDCIMASAAKINKGFVKMNNGEIRLFFEPYAVLKMLEQKGKNYEWLRGKLDDLVSTLIEIETDKNTTHEGMLHFHRWSKTPNPNAIKKTSRFKSGGGYYYVAVINPGFANFFNVEINMNYIKILPYIIRLHNGLLQAFVRFCISHNELNMPFIDVLHNIRAEISDDRQRQRTIKKINDNVELLYDKFKIKLENGIVYHRHADIEGIYFISPETSADKGVGEKKQPESIEK